LRPALEPLQALRYHIPRFYERMVQLTQVLGAGGLLTNPSAADAHSQIGDDIRRYYRGADCEAEARIRLSKLAWDATGTQFGQRQLQYERYYAGDPVRLGASIYLMQDHTSLLAAVDRALHLSRDREEKMNQKSKRLLDLMGNLAWDSSYDYKAERSRD
jgi:4-hydroxyphenylacetate 3-monooxygenase/anthranilate 3-monooxygenase (FAD)/4-hydroxyphenylacetate 3-monooxygenase